MYCEPLIIDYVTYAYRLFSCNAQILHTSIWRPRICIWQLFFTIYYLLASFLKHWPLKIVFRDHFGPQVKFSGRNTVAHTMRWTLGWIQDAGWVTQINVLASYVTGVLIKEITPLLENYNRKKRLSKINQFCSARLKISVANNFSVKLLYLWITVTTRYWKRLLPWNPRACNSTRIFGYQGWNVGCIGNHVGRNFKPWDGF